MTASAPPILCIPKKTTDHKTFRNNCSANNAALVLKFLFFALLRQTRKNATPMRMYNAVQTGANSQFGGLNAGFASEAYHAGIDGVVKKAPMNPARRQTTTLAASFQ